MVVVSYALRRHRGRLGAVWHAAGQRVRQGGQEDGADRAGPRRRHLHQRGLHADQDDDCVGAVAYWRGRGKEFGVVAQTGGGRPFDMETVRQRKRDMVTSFRGGGEGRLAAAGVDVIMGLGAFCRAQDAGGGAERGCRRHEDGQRGPGVSGRGHAGRRGRL